MTEPTNMKIFLAALSPASAKTNLSYLTSAPVPSSTLIFEVTSDEKDGKLYVKALFNDQQIPLGGCSDSSKCSVTDFTNWLSTSISSNDVATECKKSSHGASLS